MTEEQKRNTPVIRANKEEIGIVFGMLAACQEFDNAEKMMYKRVKAIPNGWRDLRMVKTVVNRLVDDLLVTFPYEKLVSMQKMLPHMKYKTYFGAQASKVDSDDCIISTDRLNVLAQAAHDRCKICFDGDCARCALGKVFDGIYCKDREDGRWSEMSMEAEVDGEC